MAEAIAATLAAEAAILATKGGEELAKEGANSLYNFIQRQLSYMFNYKKYIDELKRKDHNLRNTRERVQHQVEEAERQGDEIEKDVQQWLERENEFTQGVVKPIIDDEDEAKKHCFMGLCPNLIQRYRLGKKAAKATDLYADLFADPLLKGIFDKVSYSSLHRRTRSMYVRGYESFDSRMPVLQEIMQALADPKINVIGVHGMGGVGKTTLVKKVAFEAEESKLFDIVVMATVVEAPDFITRIQDEIANQIGLKVRERSESGRADRLRNRLKKQKGRVLVILDNIWKKVDLNDVGIPLGNDENESGKLEYVEEGRNDDQMQCKILLTSRKQDVLKSDMTTQKNFSVDVLSPREAENLFLKIVGDSAKEDDFQRIAKEIANKCKGLPLGIVVIANALRTKHISVWRNALHKLNRSNPRCIVDIEDKLYSTIEISYNYLESDEDKQLFLLCAMLKSSPQISTELLLKHSMGLGLFQDVDTVEIGRIRLRTIIDNLKASWLLLDGDKNDFVQMHDVVHMVAISIASTLRNIFNDQNVTELKETWEEKIPRNSTAISLSSSNTDNEILEKLEFPRLELFRLCMKESSSQISDKFFEGMKELKVLHLSQIHLLPLPSSLACLMNLRTLRLSYCVLGDITIIGVLKKLIILSFYGSDIEQLPKAIGELTRLRLLDLDGCLNLKVIAPNVISGLHRLEELYIDSSFVQWDNEGEIPSNASLAELKQLSHLSSLKIHVQDATFMPHDVFFQKLESFYILIGLVWNRFDKYDSQRRTLKLRLDNHNHLTNSIRILLKRAEELYLDELNGFTNILSQLDLEGFPQLKLLHVQNDHQLSYIINTVEEFSCEIAFPELESLFLYDLNNLKICRGRLCAKSFGRLRVIKIRKCDRLECLFSFSMAVNLSQLQELEVIDCKNLRVIFGEEDEDHVHQVESTGKIELTSLHSITLKFLPQLINFGLHMETPLISQVVLVTDLVSKEITEENEAKVYTMALFSHKVVLPRLENLKLSSINVRNIWLNQKPSEMPSYVQSLKSLTVEKCHGLKFLFMSSMVNRLAQLQKLVINNCKSMEEMVAAEALEEEKHIVFDKLINMEIKGLPKLKRFGTGDLVEFPFLSTLQIENCPNLEIFFSSSSPTERNLENSTDYINIHPLFDEKVAFPCLETLRLINLDNLRLIWHNHLYANSFSKLKEITVESCETLTTIVASNAQGLPSFQNLEILDVAHCGSMKNLFPVSIATGLLQLKNIYIGACGLEEIVAAEEIEGDLIKFVFPQLEFLFLHNMRKLTNFYPGLHSLEWPMLKKLVVHHCHNMEIFGSKSLSFHKRNEERQRKSPFQQPLILLGKDTHNLEILSLNSDDINSICLSNFQADMFCKVKRLDLFCFHDGSAVFPFGFLQRFHSLEKLVIASSDFKELFTCEGLDDKEKPVVLKPIRHLRLMRLDHLAHIWKQDSQVDPFLQNVETLFVSNCGSLTYLMPSSVHLKNLTDLEVRCCNRLQYILSRSTAKRLVHLTTMAITECNSVTEVTANEVERTNEEIVFSKLKTLELRCLPSITCFCSANYSFKFPCLEKVIVSQCPKFETFCQGALSAPKLNRLQITTEADEEYFWKDDLNFTVKQMFEDMVGFRNLEHLRFSEFPSLAEKIWNG